MMKKRILKTCAVAVCALTTFASTSCAFLGGKLLAKPAKAEELAYSVYKEEAFQTMQATANDFAAKFASSAFSASKEEDNFAVAPVSVFMALALAAECSAGNTQTEILSALNLSYEELIANISNLYRSINVEHINHGYLANEKVTGRAILGNSIWVNEDTSVKDERIQSLAENYFCYSYRADFLNKNASANKAVQKFVKDQTKGLVDEDFALPKETLFALINTLYLKDNWNYDGSKIALTDKEYTFTSQDGERETLKLLQRGYKAGRAYEGEGFTSFYTSTYNGYKLKFILPNEGRTIEEVFTAENIVKVNAVKDYNAEDHEQLKRYYTRCFFPQFEAEYDGDVRGILRSMFGVNELFEFENCNFSPLTDEKTVCGEVRHTVELSVDRRGIEGAAVTVMLGAGAPGPDEYEEVYLDFVVDRTFGFLITDSYGTILFSGVVDDVD